MTPRPVADDELHAFADDQLDPARKSEIAAWLADNPDAAARVAAYRRINEALHRRFDGILAEPIPAAMRRPPRWSALSLRRAGIAAGWLIAGMVGGWFAHDALIGPKIVERVVTAPPPIAVQAAQAHSVYSAEVRHPVEVGASDEAHLVRWLSNRMGRDIKAPRLEDAGYRLMGGRLLPGVDGGMACQFMYENAAGTRVTLFIRSAAPNQTQTAFRFAVERNGVGVFYWLDRNFGYAISANLPREELLRLAREVYDQLNT